MSWMSSLMAFWNISLAELVPKFNLAYLLSPLWVANFLMYQLSGARDSWWYPDRKYSFENTVAVLRVWIRSSTVGLGCCFQWITLLAILISTQIRTFSFFLGMMTIGEIHGVGPAPVIWQTDDLSFGCNWCPCVHPWSCLLPSGKTEFSKMVRSAFHTYGTSGLWLRKVLAYETRQTHSFDTCLGLGTLIMTLDIVFDLSEPNW